MASGDAVANEPRLFVGQIPADCTEEDLWPLFSPFVLYARWAQAEAAAEALDGAAALTAGQGRPLVVHFANPRKPPPGQPAELGLAPKKLFVGQVPRDVTEEDLRPLFAPHGDIEHINILRTQRGQSAGCGFVQFRKWAQAEEAMEALNGKRRLSNSEVPLVVKFADAKRREQPLHTLGLGYKRGAGYFPDPKHLADPAAEFAMFQLSQQWPGLLPGASPMLGNGMLGNQLALQQGMQSLMTNYPPAPYSPGPGQYGVADPALMQHGLHAGSLGLGADAMLDGRLQESHLHTGASLGAQSALTGAATGDPLSGQLLTNTGSLGTSVTQSSLSQAQPLQHAGPSGSLGSLPVTTADLAQQLSELNMASLGSQRAPSEASSGTPFAGQPQQQSLAGALPDLTGAGLGPAHLAGQSLGGLPGGLSYRPDIQSLQYLQGIPQLSSTRPGLPALGGRPGEPLRQWGQRIGNNDRFNEWKLFVGQVPVDETEDFLYQIFAPIGEVLELYILRNNNQKSRGCAFVTYASKALAEEAISRLNGKLLPSGKALVVKFADRASANRPAQAQNPLLGLYGLR